MNKSPATAPEQVPGVRRYDPRTVGGTGPAAVGGRPQAGLRVGTGWDSHRFGADRPLVLAGVRFPDAPGLIGFSDADAVAHAVIDALLGAACLGDVGAHFPPGDERWRGADSMDLLARAVAVLSGAGWRVGNVDVTVICESPRIGPRAPEMRAALSARLGVDAGAVSVKGKSNEGMGWIGRGEGIAVQAVATVVGKASADAMEDRER